MSEPEKGTCPECGAEIPEGANFCPVCGARVKAIMGAVSRLIEDYQRVLRDSPDNADAHYNLALAYMQAEDYVAAEKELLEVLRLEPQFADALVRLGRICIGRGEAEKAREYLLKALAIDPDEETAVRLLASIDTV